MEDKIPEICRRHSDFCSIFTNPRRLMILKALGDGERSVGDIAKEVGIPDYTVSQHLRIMKDRGAVRARKEGRMVYYRVASQKFIEGASLIREGLLDVIEETSQLIGKGD